jgi:hypothetical protein
VETNKKITYSSYYFGGYSYAMALIGVAAMPTDVSRFCPKKYYSLKGSSPMQSVPIPTDGVSSNLDQGEVYNIV